MIYDDEKRPVDDESGEDEHTENITNEDKSGETSDGGHGEDHYSNRPQYYDCNNYGKKPSDDKKPKDSYMSKKAVGWIVALCLVVSIVCGICANAITGIVRSNKGETTDLPAGTTTAPAATTTSSGETTTSPSDVIIPISGVNAKDIPLATKTTDGVLLADYAEVAEKCINSVVQIEATETVQSYYYGPQTSVGRGSGVIYTTNGYIITNYHVVGKNTEKITVTLYDGTKYEGAYICGDESADVSVIKINKNDCVAAKIGDSDALDLGEQVLAIGNPLGYGITLSDGIISALSRTVTVDNTTMTLMQTTAAINSGNSGGGLFNMKGELIGITNAKVGGTSVEAMGYAIPSEKVIKCVNDFSKYGYLTGVARLGVSIYNYLEIGRDTQPGYIRVATVKEGGTAALAGIKPGDIIRAIDNTNCGDFAILTELLTKYKVGDTVTMEILRPTEESETSGSAISYLLSCKKLTLNVTFVEFDPS